MAKRNKKPGLADIGALLAETDKLLYKKKAEVRLRKPCAKCGSIPIHAAELCRKCFYSEREAREKARVGKVWISTDGYKRVYNDDGKIQLYHRYVVEQFIGRPLRRDEPVKFKDGDTTNCDIDNLLFGGFVDLSLLVCPNCGMNFTAPPQPLALPELTDLPKLPDH